MGIHLEQNIEKKWVFNELRNEIIEKYVNSNNLLYNSMFVTVIINMAVEYYVLNSNKDKFLEEMGQIFDILHKKKNNLEKLDDTLEEHIEDICSECGDSINEKNND